MKTHKPTSLALVALFMLFAVRAHAAAPTVMTLIASGISNTIARLNGTVNPNGLATTAWFEWGTTNFNYSQQTAPVTVGNGSASLAVSNNLSSLTPGVIYHGRVSASNALGVARGSDVTFRSPVVTLIGGAVLTNECHLAFTDPGATVVSPPLAVAGGGQHSMALKGDGKVAAWGRNGDGETTIPVGLSNVVAIGGGSQSLALKSDGTVVAWGYNGYGQANVPLGLSNVVAIAAGGSHSLAQKNDGTIVAWGFNLYGQTNIPAGLSNVVAIAGGGFHSLALKSDGTVVAVGAGTTVGPDPNYGQSIVPMGLSNVVAIAGGGYHSLALKSDGTVAAWGAGTNNTGSNPNYGQSIILVGLSNVVAIAGGQFHSLALKSDGTVAAWGYNFSGQTNVPVGLSNVVAIAAGSSHSLALKRDGTVVAWGFNNSGQTTIPASVYLTNAVTSIGSVNTNSPGSYPLTYATTNYLGSIGTATRTVMVTDTLAPVVTVLGSNPLTNFLNVPFVDPGATNLDSCGGSVAMTTNSTVNVAVAGTYAISYIATDSSGNSATNSRVVVVVVILPPTVTTLAASGMSNTIARLNGTVNPNGQTTTEWFEWGTASSNYTQQTTPVAVGNGSTSLAVSNNLTGLTPGVIYYGRMAASNVVGVVHGNDVQFGSPAITLIGGTVLTNECHSAFTDPGATVVGMPMAIAGGFYYSLALKSDGMVVAWGQYFNGTSFVPMYVPVGLSNMVAIAAGGSHSLALKSDRTVAAWGHNGEGQTNIPVGLSNVVAIAGGSSHSLALKSDGTVAAWGQYFNGTSLVPMYVPVDLSNVVAIAGGGDHDLALKSDGTVVAWGYNAYGQTNSPAGLSNVVAIAGGGNHNLALKSDGTVVAWGYNASGQTNIPVGLSNVVAIAAGGNHSLALKSDGTVVAWGYNGYGQTTIPAGLSSIPFTVSGSMNTNSPGSYTLTYTVTNFLGGIATPVTRTVIVSDTLAPVITLLGANPLTNLLNVSFVDSGATNLDACGGSVAMTTNSTINVAVAGTYAVSYTATDSYGNSATNSRVVVVVGSPPSISGLAAAVIATNGVNGNRTVNFAALVNPNGLATTVNFLYGLTTSYGGTNSVPGLPASFTGSNVTSSVDLSAGFTYHWRVVAANSGGSTSSPDQMFNLGTLGGGGIPGDVNNDGIVSQSELDAVYASYVTNSPWLYLTNVAGLGGTNVTFSLANSVLGAYTVEYSTNLTNWQPLGPASPRYLFEDTNAPAVPQRYYRLRYP